MFACVHVSTSTIISAVHQTDQGIKNLSVERAGDLAGANPDYALKDLFDAIGSGSYVSYYVSAI